MTVTTRNTTHMTRWGSLCLGILLMASITTSAFQIQMNPTKLKTTPTTTTLCMGKGLNKNRNKQAELAKKLALAKQQKEGGDDSDASSAEPAEKTKLSAKEMKEKNDRLRFEELLKTKSVSLHDMNDGYLTAEQEQDEIAAATRRRNTMDRLFEGDPAPTDPFAELVDVQGGSPDTKLGDRGARRLLQKHKYTIVLCDPRPKSYELRTALDTLAGSLPQDLRQKLIIINADSPAENKRYWKKKGLQKSSLSVYSDESLEWMRSYTALGEKRWSIFMYVIANEKIQKLARDVDSISVTRTICNAVKSLDM